MTKAFINTFRELTVIETNGLRKYVDLDSTTKLEIYNHAIELRKRGFGCKKIKRVIQIEYNVDISATTIQDWFRGATPKHNPRSYNKVITSYCEKIEKAKDGIEVVKILEELHKFDIRASYPIPRLCKELAYCITAALGDGCLVRDSEGTPINVRLRVKDHEFAMIFAKSLAIAVGRRQPYSCFQDKKESIWITTGGGRIFAAIIAKAKEDPWFVWPILKLFPAESCQGFFDAEGSSEKYYSFYRHYARNSSYDLLKIIQLCLKLLGIHSKIYTINLGSTLMEPKKRKIYLRKQATIYQLVIYRKIDALRFIRRIGYNIRRKQQPLTELIKCIGF